MEDFAFIKLDSGRYLCGMGPFVSADNPPEDGQSAFYRNNFELSDELPWKIPARVFETADLRVLLPDNGATPLPEIAWSGLGDADVRLVFDEILSQIQHGDLKKSVPVLTERGILHRGEPSALVKAIIGAPENLWGYGYREGFEGMIGATPEQLFTVEKGVLETMALAGTAPRHEVADFPSDPKEIREHELVADYLEELLSPFGRVERDERGLLDLGSIVHFITRLSVVLDNGNGDLNELIRRMHPTPALGACPRGEGALRQLVGYRERLGVPEDFGAPFGALHEGSFQSLVAIRNVSWVGRAVALPSGVGLVEGSRFDREWRELALKRNSVKSLLGV
ncbi:MAG: isochorismate synthase [Verrucomicrobiales bacterium]|jgi:menaquinone-specific isochorismate synthase|nr:isochorismate synthase [Verrucomicrobiales bacterium]|tara:strand:+ start:102 stop:1115 length:1014 start_codon:yes stop_codon:yes gene_type:complete